MWQSAKPLTSRLPVCQTLPVREGEWNIQGQLALTRPREPTRGRTETVKRFRDCNQRYRRPAQKTCKPQEMDRLMTAILRVWHIAEGEWTVGDEGDLGEELQRVERVKRMGGVLSSRPVSVPTDSADKTDLSKLSIGLWARSTACTNAGLFLVGDSWNSYECSVFIRLSQLFKL